MLRDPKGDSKMSTQLYQRRNLYHEVSDQTFNEIKALFETARAAPGEWPGETPEATALWDFLDVACCKGGCTEDSGVYYGVYQIAYSNKRFAIFLDSQDDTFHFDELEG